RGNGYLYNGCNWHNQLHWNSDFYSIHSALVICLLLAKPSIQQMKGATREPQTQRLCVSRTRATKAKDSGLSRLVTKTQKGHSTHAHMAEALILSLWLCRPSSQRKLS